MADRLNSPAWESRTFKYIEMDTTTHKNCIDLIVLYNGRERKARLPKKLVQRRFIQIFPNDKEVTIPNWLCVEQGLA
ncbi:MAG: hypothetical protein JXL81_11945 [Deltaproteobacteria bacterium]|nr:hypothetical protein [Deltaproteobacteria bacterium]